jgi:hypothetical protein
MSSARHQLVVGAVVSAVLVGCCGAGGCNNDNFANHGVITVAPRFQLVVEEEPAPARLLLDSVTGDLWQLHGDATSGPQWVRVASGPADARVLTPQEILGARPPQTPAP